MVEDVEERGDGLLGGGPLLHVVDDQHVDGLIEIDEVVDRVLTAGIGELHLEQTGADVEHTLFRIRLLAAHADGIDEVRLATARRTYQSYALTRLDLQREVFKNRWQVAVVAEGNVAQLYLTRQFGNIGHIIVFRQAQLCAFLTTVGYFLDALDARVGS